MFPRSSAHPFIGGPPPFLRQGKQKAVPTKARQKPCRKNRVVPLNPLGFNHYWLTLALSPLRQPRRQPVRKALRSQAITYFHPSIRLRQGIVELRRIRKIPHTKLIQPLQRTNLAFSQNHYVHLQFLRIHNQRIAFSRGSPCLRTKG
jgi:hypothetical protein